MAKKSSKAALSLLIVLVAFLGFNSITGVEMANVTSQVQSTISSTPEVTESANKSLTSTSNNSSSKNIGNDSGISAKISRAVFAGTDKNGLPLSFTVADAGGNLGSISVTSQIGTQLPDGFSLTSNAMSASSNSLNVLLAQTLIFNPAGVSYSVTPAVTINGVWFALDLNSTDSSFTRLSDGSYLVSVDLLINSTIESAVTLEAKNGLSVGSIPNKIQTSILVDSSKSRILAQAIFVNAKGVK